MSEESKYLIKISQPLGWYSLAAVLLKRFHWMSNCVITKDWESIFALGIVWRLSYVIIHIWSCILNYVHLFWLIKCRFISKITRFRVRFCLYIFSIKNTERTIVIKESICFWHWKGSSHLKWLESTHLIHIICSHKAKA